jgi:hypothetical protein
MASIVFPASAAAATASSSETQIEQVESTTTIQKKIIFFSTIGDFIILTFVLNALFSTMHHKSDVYGFVGKISRRRAEKKHILLPHVVN